MNLPQRYRNYLVEAEALERKLKNPGVDGRKKERCAKRLSDVVERLLPGLQKGMERASDAALTPA